MKLMSEKKNYLIPCQHVVDWESENHFLTVSGHATDVEKDPNDDEGWGKSGGNVREERFTNYNAFDTTW